MNTCNASTLLVCSPEPEIAVALERKLGEQRMRVVAVAPGVAFVRSVMAERPLMAVLDRVDERPVAAQMEVELLKIARPEVRIVVLSAHSTPHDAALLKQGVLYFVAQSWRQVLAQVVDAAIQAEATRA
ncbi:MAG: hypothetical protein HYV63_04455 [Candidatus Schekmanbacteria bacterium]|nr:hypothetical protein [Candidatus Schekmanbacteria bacterium]